LTVLQEKMAVDFVHDSGAVVPGAEHYRSRYLGPDAIRLFSYRQQLVFALRYSVKSVLIVGKGDGLVAQLLSDYGVQVTTLDIAADLQPDLLGSVTSIPAAQGSFDLTLCCQVLEHLPFEQFSLALREIRRVTRGYLVLSLPDIRRFVSFRVVLPKVRLDWQLSIPRFRAPVMPAARREQHGHYWEIGYQGSSFRDVRSRVLRAGWHVLKVLRVGELPWHTFFHCKNV
jgi:SAM-dependent methyltransferase